MTANASTGTTITTFSSGALRVVQICGPYSKQFNITADIANSERPAFEIVHEFARQNGATVLAQRAFGRSELHAGLARFPEEALSGGNWPVTWLQGYEQNGANPITAQAMAISGVVPEPILLNGQTVGFVFEDEAARYCVLGNLCARDTSHSQIRQAREVFETVESALQLAELGFSHVVRTWFYLDDILSWYDGFNRVRTQFFEERHIFEGLVPASTGVGSANALGAALVADVLAVKRKSDNVRVREVRSPLQCASAQYGSSFSRAVEIVSPYRCDLYISGTASIDADGITAYRGDVEEQIGLTMRVVEAILKSRGMGWVDVTKGVAYFRNNAEKGLIDRYCNEGGLPHLPIAAVAPFELCRSDLLFEIEVDAVSGFGQHV